MLPGGQLLKTAELPSDEAILLHIRDKDMVAIEVRHHRSCHKKYVKVRMTASFAHKGLLIETTCLFFLVLFFCFLLRVSGLFFFFYQSKIRLLLLLFIKVKAETC